MANAVELHGIRKTYDHFVAVDHLSLNIREGSVYGLLGPNGAGKTSTIRMMIGITMPDEGEVWLFGEKFHREQLRRIGYLPEERGLYKRMKVIDHLVFLGRLHNLSEHEARKRSLVWCERLQISDWTQKKVEELSKGMQQKIQFIAALLHDPDLVIMDEPFCRSRPFQLGHVEGCVNRTEEGGQDHPVFHPSHGPGGASVRLDLPDRSRPRCAGGRSRQKIKSSYGKNHLQMQYEGDPQLEGCALVESLNNYGNYVEVRLKPGADAQQLLRLASDRARISRFELLEPSLEEIFIDQVGKNA